MDLYRTHALESATGVELTIVLYDGVIRFMCNAIDAVDRNDPGQRRAAVKRAMDIIIHLQATLDMDAGGKPAEALSEFYAAMFALMLQGSQAKSRKRFEEVIVNVRNVRDAWRQIAAKPGLDPAASHYNPGQHHIESASGWPPEDQPHRGFSVSA
jgi:flagellar protein FliS